MNFKDQAEKFMVSIATRRRNPVKSGTLVNYRSLLNKWVLPALGDLTLSEVQNGTVKALVETLSQAQKSSQTITSIVSLVKQVVASAIDANGNELYPRTWNNDFMDVPVVETASQDAPIIGLQAVSGILRQAIGQDKALVALLAGSGLRIGEARALKVGQDDGVNSFWDPQTGTIRVRTTVVRGKIQNATKTKAGDREVDLAPELNEFLKANVTVTDGLVFQNEDGGITNEGTLYRHLQNVGVQDGFHAFRRARVTYLKSKNVPDMLIKFWIGHEAGDITERYTKIGSDIETRKEVSRQVGLGFELA